MRRVRNHAWRMIVGAVVASVAVAGAVQPAHGRDEGAMHPEAVLESDRSTVDAGGAIGLRGSQFGADEEYVLELQGALDEHELGTVSSDGEGLFTESVTIPPAVRPGAYQVVALAPDGDIAARLDVTVTAAAAMPAQEHTEMEDASMEDHEPAARADEITVERDRSGVEWAAIGLLIGAAGGLGIGLRRRSA